MNGIDNYDFESKNEWRKSVWDEIKRRWGFFYDHIRVPVKNATVLYLSGEQDLDRKEAIRRGFSSDNLISIEIDKDNSKILRKKGNTVINGDLRTILWFWPKGKRVDLVFADFCSGLDPDFIYRFAHVMEHEEFWSCLFLFNFQRGRDPRFKELMVENTLKKAAYYKDVNDKHRGLILYSYLFHDLWIPNGNDLIASFLKDLKINYPHGWQVNRSHGYLLPRFWQYKSNRGQIIMDSVLFYNAFKCLTSYRTCSDENKNDFMRELIAEKNNILLGRTLLRLNETRIGVNELEMRKRFPYYESMRDRGVSESISKRADGCTFRSINRYYDRNTVEKTKRAITNALAIRTMRLNGTLPHSSLD